jgi:TonB family protein
MTGGLTKLLTVLLLFSGACAPLRAQNPNASTQENVGLTKLFQPIYPLVAKQAGVKGDVELELKVKADGNLESATVVSGHPLLTQAALESAKHSQFECRSCGAEGTRFRILYSFQLGPTSYCTDVSDKSKAEKKQETYPKVTQEQNHITLIDQPVGTCDLAFKVVERKVRSIKCLYLWKCGLTDWHEEPVAAPH